jgi:hypothetical protein
MPRHRGGGLGDLPPARRADLQPAPAPGQIRERVLAIREQFERSNDEVEEVIDTVTKAMDSKSVGDEEAEGGDLRDPEEESRLSGSREDPISVTMVEGMPSNLLLRLQKAL